MKNAENVIKQPVDLRIRSLQFAKDVIRFTRTLPQTVINRPIINQLVKSSSSIGANFTEAKNASSKRDFTSKVYISKKEAAETLYWLKVCDEIVLSKELKDLQAECQEILLILQQIITTLKH